MRYRYQFLVVFLVSLMLFSALYFVSSVPRAFDEYFALYTLGLNGKVGQYFPSGNPDILPGDKLPWSIGVYNHMNSLELVQIRIKLLNLTMKGPNQLDLTSSPQPFFFEETRLLLRNETWMLPFSWSVFNATRTPNGTEIHSISLNGNPVAENTDVPAINGYNYRILIELWIYDETSDGFAFQWNSGGVGRVAWNQVWFNMTRTSIVPS